jgi:hypothetical protein
MIYESKTLRLRVCGYQSKVGPKTISDDVAIATVFLILN